MRVLRPAGSFLLAVLATTAAGSVVQTQFNLAELTALGVEVPVGMRLQATGHDLLSFSPAFGAIAAAGFLCAFCVAGLLRRWLAWPAPPLFTAAGAAAILTALLAMEALMQLTPVAAARSLAGLIALVLCGGLGGWVYARVIS